MYACGYLTGIAYDDRRPNWVNEEPRPLAWSAWYPTDECASPVEQFFELGELAIGAKLSSRQQWPTVLLSHGTGGSAESLGWLARGLASQGYVVLGVNHHGNTGIEPYQPEAFLCWWERATDLSIILSILSENEPFAGCFDLDRISAIGFSLGAYTVLTLAGAITSLSEFDKWRHRANIVAEGPREFPDVASHAPRLLEKSEAFRCSWGRHGENFRDARIRSIIAIAPPPPVRAFTEGSVRSISLPVTLIVAGSDTEAPREECADWLTSLNPRFHLHNLGSNVGHYTFLGLPTARALHESPELFEDAEGVDRAKIHNEAVAIMLNALV